MTTFDPGIKGPGGVAAVTLPAFLDIMNADLHNEWTHLQFYLYHASSITGLHAAEYREFFTDAAKGEMQHVQMFLDRLFGLHFSLPNQSGKQFPICTDVEGALVQAIKLEEEVVKNYAYRLLQLDAMAPAWPVESAYFKVFYEDQLQDSYEDAERMRRILANTLTHQFRAADTAAAIAR